MAPFYVCGLTVSGNRGTTRRLFTFYLKSPGIPSTHLVNVERMKAESNLKPLTGSEPRTP